MKELKELIGSPVTYSPSIVEITGSINSAIFLNQLLYWWKRKSNGLLYKTIQEIKQETCLSKNHQITAIKILEELGFIQVFVVGLPPKRNFAINFEDIKKALKQGSNFPKNRKSIIEKQENKKDEKQKINIQESGKIICGKSENINSENQQNNFLENGKLKFRNPEKLISEKRKNYTKNTTENTTKTTTENTTKITSKNTFLCFGEKNSPDIKNFNFNNFKILKVDKIKIGSEKETENLKTKEEKKKINPPNLRVAPLNKDFMSKESSLHTKMKNTFLEIYSIKIGLAYCWSGKDGKHISELIEKFKFMLQQIEKIPDDSSILDNFKMMLENIQDTWILERFSVAIINSKFNEIASKIKNAQYGKYTEDRGNNISPEFRRKLHETLLSK